MEIKQTLLTKDTLLHASTLKDLQTISPDLVLVFATVKHLKDQKFVATLLEAFSDSCVVGCSTAGEISSAGVTEQSSVITAVKFKGSKIRHAVADITDMEDSLKAGTQLADKLADSQLRAILVFGRGVDINGSALIRGLKQGLGTDVQISGGLAGDDGAFAETFILSDQGARNDAVVAVGLYGEQIRLGYGSYGGWEAFGPTRQATRAEGNILYELDGEPALNIYKRYLGEYAEQLPASGLLFPFEMLTQNHDRTGLIRTILAVDEEQGSLTLAGEIENGGYLRLMHSNNDALIMGAEKAAINITDQVPKLEGGLALLVSCVGRKLVMGDQVDDEVEAVSEHLGEGVTITGFYSYGEINPLNSLMDCRLHNQTMTVAYITES